MASSIGTTYTAPPENYIGPESNFSDVMNRVDIPAIDLNYTDKAERIQSISDAGQKYFFQMINRDEKIVFYSDDPANTIRLHCHSLDKFVQDWPSVVVPPSFKYNAIHHVPSISNRRNLQSSSGGSIHPSLAYLHHVVCVAVNDKKEPDLDHQLINNNSSNNPTAVMIRPPGVISSMFKENDIGKTAMGYVPSALVALLINNAAFPSSALHVIVIAFSVGFALIWNGIMLRNLFQRFGRVAEQVGVIMVFLGFFGLLGSVLPLSLLWIPLLCGILFLLPFILRFLPSQYCKRIATSSRPPLLPINN